MGMVVVLLKGWKKIWSLLCSIGLPWGIITGITGILIKYQYIIDNPRSKVKLESFEDIRFILILAGFAMAFAFIKNLQHFGTDERIGMFTCFKKYKEIPPIESPELKKAQDPDIPEEYLADKPEPFTIGVKGKGKSRKYVRIRMYECLSTLIFGSPGAGKSTLLITLILIMLARCNRADVPDNQRPAMFIYDYKPELYYRTCKPDQKRVKFLTLKGRDGVGWDVFYKLHWLEAHGKEVTDDDIIEELTLIANVIITDNKGEGGSESNAYFFYENARTIFIFSGFALYRMKFSFIKIIDYLYDGNLQEKLIQLVEKCKSRPDLKKTVDALTEFTECEDNDMLRSVRATLRTRMRWAKINDLRYALEYSKEKVSPITLEDHISIFFYPGKVKTTSVVLKLISKQLEDHLSNRDFLNLDEEDEEDEEKELHQVVVCMDEMSKLAGVIDLGNWLSVARGFRTVLIPIYQSIGQVIKNYGSDTAEEILDCVSNTVILAVNSAKNAERFVDFAGEYMEESKSVTVGGSNDGQYNQTYSRRNILTKQTFLSLKKDKKAIMLADGRFFFVETEPARYYMIPALDEYSKKCIAAHREARKHEKKG